MKEIQLTQGKVALVDDDDFERLNTLKWNTDKNGYAVRTNHSIYVRRTSVLMHREILCLEKGDGKQVDHINGDKLDNRRSNLRICIKKDNAKNRLIGKDNTSGFKGVSWHKASLKWCSQISINGKSTHIGLFSTPECAHESYKKAALKYHGEFANFGNGCILMEKSNDKSR